MARTSIIFLIRIYQAVFSFLLKQLLGVSRMCRYTPSCSEYTIQMVKRNGIVKGLLLGTNQLLHCHPFAHSYGTTI